MEEERQTLPLTAAGGRKRIFLPATRQEILRLIAKEGREVPHPSNSHKPEPQGRGPGTESHCGASYTPMQVCTCACGRGINLFIRALLWTPHVLLSTPLVTISSPAHIALGLCEDRDISALDNC